MWNGVTKSGSPMPSETASFIFETIAKKSRMPDLGNVATWFATKRVESSMGRGLRG